MENEFPLFNNIIDRTIFDNLSTSEKIKLLLQKDIFFYGNMWFHNKFYCQDFGELDFSVFEKLDFCFNETYEINNISIGINPLIQPEVFEGICNSVRQCLGTTLIIDEISFNLSMINKEKDKQKYLTEEISKIDPFGLSSLYVEFDRNTNKISLAPFLSNEYVGCYPDFIKKWITGEHSLDDTFVLSYPHLENFYSSYQKFLIAEFCFNEISLIKKPQQLKGTNQDDEKSENNHPPHDPNLWNLECFNLFKYLFDEYYSGSIRQTTNIWFFLKEYDPKEYTLKATKEKYINFIRENYQIEIKNFDKAQTKYSENDYPTLNDHRKNFENSLK